MTTKSRWVVTLVALAATLVAASGLRAQDPGGDEAPSVQVVEPGTGWYLLEVGGGGEGGEAGTLIWMVSEQGLGSVPLAAIWRDDLTAEFSGAAGAIDSGEEPPFLVLLDKVALDAMEAGEIPPGYEQYYEYDERGELSCGDQNKEKHHHWQGSRSASQSWQLGGGLTGTLSANLPVDLDANLYFRYKIKRKFCIPYGVSFRNVQVAGTGRLGGNSTLNAAAIHPSWW